MESGVATRTRGEERCLPAAPRVLQMASEIQKIECDDTNGYAESTGTAPPNNEKMVRSLRRDVIYPHRDRDYRIIALFHGEFTCAQNIAIRVFYITRSICRETVPQIDVFGNSSGNGQCDWIDVFAYSGHMRWLRNTGSTTPSGQVDWPEHIDDFATMYHGHSLAATHDRDLGEINRAPLLVCRQCRRGERRPLLRHLDSISRTN